MFSINLKKIRNEKGISQKKLAEELYVSQQTIAKWETDKATPNPEMLKKIALYFNVSIDYLLGRTEKKPFPAFNLQISEQETLLLKESADLTDAEKQDVLEYIRFKKSQKRKLFTASENRIFTTADFEDNTERIAAFGGMEDVDDEPLTT